MRDKINNVNFEKPKNVIISNVTAAETQEVDKIILLSGDGDFDLLVRKVIDQHECIVDVYGVRELTARSLIKSASKFYEISKNLLL